MENELLGPASGTIGNDTAPPWWKDGTRVRRKFDGQQAKAGFTAEGGPLVHILRGILGPTREPANPSDWEPDGSAKYISGLQIAKISYEADRAFLNAVGVSSVPEWMGLGEKTRLHWMWHVTKGDQFTGEYAEARSRLALAIVSALKEAI